MLALMEDVPSSLLLKLLQTARNLSSEPQSMRQMQAAGAVQKLVSFIKKGASDSRVKLTPVLHLPLLEVSFYVLSSLCTCTSCLIQHVQSLAHVQSLSSAKSGAMINRSRTHLNCLACSLQALLIGLSPVLSGKRGQNMPRAHTSQRQVKLKASVNAGAIQPLQSYEGEAGRGIRSWNLPGAHPAGGAAQGHSISTLRVPVKYVTGLASICSCGQPRHHRYPRGVHQAALHPGTLQRSHARPTVDVPGSGHLHGSAV